MIAAVDTNIFLDVLRPNPAFVDSSRALLETHAESGQRVACDLPDLEVLGE